MQSNKSYIKEIFTSIQGEGIFVGYKQLFIRFTKCNLTCEYCDTDYSQDNLTKEYTPQELLEEIKKHDTENIHSISLTGGEPLLDSDFLKEFLPLTKNKIYLETNGTLINELTKVINFIDYVSMDIKLDSSSKNADLFDVHDEFTKICLKNNKNIFYKVVFDENITDEEIEKTIELAQKHNVTIILQPLMLGNKMKPTSQTILKVTDKFIEKYQDTRLIPQVHKFLNVE